MGNTGDTSEAVRSFDTSLSVGERFSIQMDSGSIDSDGIVGLALRNASGDNLAEVYFQGGDSNYTVNDSDGEDDTGIGWTDEGIKIDFTLTSAATYRVTLTPLGGGPPSTLWGSLIDPGSGQDVSQARLFNANAGSGSSNDAFFNGLRIGYATTEFSSNSAPVSGNTVQMRTIQTALRNLS